MKKTYQVELKRISYVTVTVEAESPDHADERAWEELQKNESVQINDAQWETESITEIKA